MSDEDERKRYQHQTLLKAQNLDPGIRNAVDLAPLLLDDVEQSTVQLAALLYDLSEGDHDGEGESQEEPSSRGEESVEESPPVWDFEQDVIASIKLAMKQDDTVQRIMLAKTTEDRKVPPDIVRKEKIKLELGDCHIRNDLLYVKDRIYVPNDPKLKTSILKEIHESPPGGHAGRASTYKRLSRHYY